MEKSNLDLFRQAINEGLSNGFDSVANSYTDNIVCSEKHMLAMRTIVYGKADTKRVWTPKMKRIIAILIAAAILLTSCGVIFRNEIREVFDELFVILVVDNNDNQVKFIEDVYVLEYVPEGYILTEEISNISLTQYTYKNSEDKILVFEQSPINGTEYVVDTESGYSEFMEVEEYKIYYRVTSEFYNYFWNDEKYLIYLRSTAPISNDELTLIIEGITIK